VVDLLAKINQKCARDDSRNSVGPYLIKLIFCYAPRCYRCASQWRRPGAEFGGDGTNSFRGPRFL